MQTIPIQQAAEEFLAVNRIAVAGVSRETDGMHSGNGVFERLIEKGYDAYATNPHADEIEDERFFTSLRAIPGGVEAVVIATNPKDSPAVMQECIDLGVKQVWLHKSFGQGSYSNDAENLGRDAGIRVIPNGCPLMFGECSDGGHRFMKTILTWTGSVSRKV